MSAARYGHLGAAISSGNKVLVAGGYTSSYSNSAEIRLHVMEMNPGQTNKSRWVSPIPPSWSFFRKTAQA